MLAPVRFLVSSALIAICACTSAARVPAEAPQPAGSSLQEHYEAAERLLEANQIDQAADQFRLFLSEAIGALAMGRAHEGDYAKAAPLFNEALALEPKSPSLRLEFANASLVDGDFAEAQSLSAAFPTDFPGASSTDLAQAHQILGLALNRTHHDQEARKELEAAVALDPSFTNLYDLAAVCLDVDDENCAVRAFAQIEASAADTPALHMKIGLGYGSSDFATRAVAEFKKVIAEDPRYPEAHYCLAAAMLATGGDETTVQAAQDELRKELAVSPNDFLTYAALGKLAAAHLQYADAERYLKRATVLNPKNPDAFLYLGQMDFDTHNYPGAETALRQAIRLTTDVARNRYQIQKAHYLLGRILMQQHHEDQAHAEMQIARDLANKVLSNDKSELAGMLAGASASTDPGGAQPAADAAASAAAQDGASPEAMRAWRAREKQLAPAIADSYNNLGAIAATGKKYPEALADFKRATAWNPTLDGLDYNLGHAAFMASQFAEAVAPLTRYLAAHPADSGVRTALAISQFMTLDYTGCVATLARPENRAADLPQVQFVYADSLVKTGKVAAGKQQLEALETAHPEIPDVHRGLGEAYALGGETQNAFRELRTAAGLNARDPETHFDLGALDLKQGDTAGAIGELESAVRLRPDDPEFHRELAHAYNLAFRVADAQKEIELYRKLQAAQAPQAGTKAAPEKTDP
jgi:tetratricopeptide (TPR) repeat protein